MKNNNLDRVTVYLSAYNGERFIREQIESILHQKGVQVHLFIRDDGSTDGTKSILDEYSQHPNITVYYGKNMGYARSFLWLVANDLTATESAYFAFSDQDDVWLPEKLMKGIKCLKQEHNDSIPLLYASSLQRVNQELRVLDLQDFPRLVPTLQGEFTRHRLAGCTFVFNNRLHSILKKHQAFSNICSHDAFATIACLSCSGKLFFDYNAYILFRRHESNTSLDNQSTLKKVKFDVERFLARPHIHRNLAKAICKDMGTELSSAASKYLSRIATYDKSMLKTIGLACSSTIDCGFWYYNLFIRFMILMRKY